MIPKIIHYCWFGYGSKPEVFEKCIDSWKKYLPDFEIIEWNENNTNLHENAFLEAAYRAKKYAFVSDVVRCQVVYDMGGIYLDTDVELLSSFEEFMSYDAFFFFQSQSLSDARIATGLGFGAHKHNTLLKKLLEDYKNSTFDISHMTELACPVKNTQVIKNIFPTFRNNNSRQLIEGILFVESNAYHLLARHYGECSWMSEAQIKTLQYKKKKHGHWKLKQILRNPKIFLFFDNHHMKPVSKIYRFLIHDIIDNGIIYWVIRLLQKISGKG